MMKLTVYPNNFTEPSDSPFCVKAMCLLEMADQQWTPHFSSDPRKAPKAKFPVLQDGDRLIADSDQIRDYLENTYQVDFDNGLGSEQRGISRAVIRMAEEHLYFALVCDRWVNDANWAQIKKAYFKDIPFLVNGFITRMIRKQVFGQLNGQ
ncbi:MAG: glutathione S-transferase family protein, partial [Planctomycetes bacterium]|nr:glutathione S-transferase family protein [Planctomycetota bacterium]